MDMRWDRTREIRKRNVYSNISKNTEGIKKIKKEREAFTEMLARK